MGLRSWLYIVVRNALIDQLRANSHQPTSVDTAMLERYAKDATRASTAEQPDRRHFQTERIKAILEKLSVMDQRILIEGASTPDEWTSRIADEAGMTPNALRVRRHRLLERLRREMSTSVGKDTEDKI